MSTLYTKDDRGFRLWLKDVRKLDRQFRLFKKGIKDIFVWGQEYRELTKLKSQLNVLTCYLNDDEQEYLACLVLDDDTSYDGKDTRVLYQKVYQVWLMVVFPKNKPAIKTVDQTMLGGNIKAERMRRNMTTATLAKLAEIGTKSLYNYESGIRMMRVDDFYRICQVLNIDEKKLLKASER